MAKTSGGHYIVTPDNGTLTHIKRMSGIVEARVIDETVNRLPNSGESYTFHGRDIYAFTGARLASGAISWRMSGIVEARVIDETVNRLPNSGESYTFHGRDIYAFTGARLASGAISWEQVGPAIDPASIVELPVVDAVLGGDVVSGTIDVLDVRFGSLWTNIPRALFASLNIEHGQRVEITISNDTRVLYKNIMVYAKSFADVYVGEPLLYVNSLDNLAVAINQGSFARAYNIGTGTSWRISVRKAPRMIYE